MKNAYSVYADNFLSAYTLHEDKQLSAYTLNADKKLSAYTLYADKANHKNMSTNISSQIKTVMMHVFIKVIILASGSFKC